MTKIALQLAIFVVAAVPGYVLAIARLDKIGHRRLQLLGFAMMAVCFLIIAAIPGMTTMVVPFLLVYGVSYFFTEFGPNMTTFVMPSELYPVTMRATGHGISAGIGKLGAFIGVFLFPLLNDWLGLRGTLLLTAGVAAARLRAHPGAARTRRTQPGRHAHQRPDTQPSHWGRQPASPPKIPPPPPDASPGSSDPQHAASAWRTEPRHSDARLRDYPPIG